MPNLHTITKETVKLKNWTFLRLYSVWTIYNAFLFLVSPFSVHSGCSCQTGRLFPRLRSPATFSVILCHYYSIHVCIVNNRKSLLDEIVTCCICFNVSLVYSAVQCLTMAITNGNLLYNFDIALSTSFYAVCQRISVYFSNRIWTSLILRQS